MLAGRRLVVAHFHSGANSSVLVAADNLLSRKKVSGDHFYRGGVLWSVCPNYFVDVEDVKVDSEEVDAGGLFPGRNDAAGGAHVLAVAVRFLLVASVLIVVLPQFFLLLPVSHLLLSARPL